VKERGGERIKEFLPLKEGELGKERTGECEWDGREK